jgi:hypothetical protein
LQLIEPQILQHLLPDLQPLLLPSFLILQQISKQFETFLQPVSLSV